MPAQHRDVCQPSAMDYDIVLSAQPQWPQAVQVVDEFLS